MAVGKLRHRVIIQTATRTSDSMGGVTETWAEWKSVWASIEPVSANQTWFSQQLQHRITHKIMIRHIEAVTSDMRIKYGTRLLQVHGIRTIEERERYIEMMCEEGSAT